jgi:hypothetical protein
MNELERLLTEDVQRLIDRLATSLPPDTVRALRTSMPRLWARIEEADQRLADVRILLVEEYAHWRQELEEVENLWALAAWKTAMTEEPVIDVTRTAA